MEHLSVDELRDECFILCVSVLDDRLYQLIDLPLSDRCDCL